MMAACVKEEVTYSNEAPSNFFAANKGADQCSLHYFSIDNSCNIIRAVCDVSYLLNIYVYRTREKKYLDIIKGVK